MGNLGFHAVFRILSTLAGVVCSRAFLAEDGSGVEILGEERSLLDFDVLAFSLSFESDYPNIVRMLDAAKIPARAGERADGGRRRPLLMAGGPATFLNPEPIAPFFDAFLIGEGEEMIPEAFTQVAARLVDGVEGVIEAISSIDGAYLPSEQSSAKVSRRYVADLDLAPVETTVVSPDAVFGDYFLVEASRGCEWGCRFCAAGFMYRPVRHRSSAGVLGAAERGLEHAKTIGLVGAEMASHPSIAGTCEKIAGLGGRVSPSSLKADMISPRLAAAVAGGGTRSVTVAPEAGSERMRRVINKNLSEEEILRAVDLMVGDGVDSLKIYVMCGLPTETDEDLQGIVGLVLRIRETMMVHGRKRGRIGNIKVSINPFVPKPWTPFQWDRMESVAAVQKKLAWLRKQFGKMANVDMESESPREAYLQTLLSRGDRQVAAVVEALARTELGWWQELQAWRRGERDPVLNIDGYVTREYDMDEPLPWDFIDHHISSDYLRLERKRALAEQETQPCDVSTCHTCGAC